MALKIKDTKSIKRHLLKTISYRIIATTTTVCIAYFLGATIQIASLIGFAELAIKPIIYFLHERLWYKLPFFRK